MSDAPAKASTPAPDTQTRKGRLLLFALICLLLTGLYGLYWFFIARYSVFTDNAYVQGHVVQVTPLTGGTVVAVNVNDTDPVHAGQPLVRLDPTDAQLALDAAAAELAQTVREVRALYATNRSLKALLGARQADLARLKIEEQRIKDDLARRKNLVGSGAVAAEELQHLAAALRAAGSMLAAGQAALNEAAEQLQKNQTQTAGTEMETHPRVLAAAARYRSAWLNHQRGEILAPLAGTVARRNVQVGQRLNSGMPLMDIVPLDQLWVDANFKESQLARLRLGQEVILKADVYGSSVKYHGRIAGLAAGTGAAFALLPAQNATGNWIKIVQRVPVRVVLDAKELADHPLRVGLSMTAEVDTRDRSGSELDKTAASQQPSITQIYDQQEAAASTRVDEIIGQNLGRRVHLRSAQ